MIGRFARLAKRPTHRRVCKQAALQSWCSEHGNFRAEKKLQIASWGPLRSCRARRCIMQNGRPRCFSSYGWDETTNPAPVGCKWHNQATMEPWPAFEDFDSWLQSSQQSLAKIRRSLEEDGFAVVKEIVPEDLLERYLYIHDQLVDGDSMITPGRHDLGSHKPESVANKENIGQIMWPSDCIAGSRDGPLHNRCYELSKILLGEDMAFDFDMLIWKNPKSRTETPWHQDESYWPPGMTDKRAITVWTALDRATLDNGAMWFLQGKQPRLLPHRPAGPESHVLMTDLINEESKNVVCVPLEPGSAVLWTGRTCHYSRGNLSDACRRTYIVNFRPSEMVKWERENGFDHLRKGLDDYENQMKSTTHNTSKARAK